MSLSLRLLLSPPLLLLAVCLHEITERIAGIKKAFSLLGEEFGTIVRSSGLGQRAGAGLRAAEAAERIAVDLENDSARHNLESQWWW